MNFYLPDFCNEYKLNMYILKLKQEHPEYFNDNMNIKAIYGSFPGMIWNGGRNFYGYSNYNEIKSTIEDFNKIGIALRFTLTNCMLQEHQVLDTYCNMVLETANTGMNEIIVNSSILENFLRQRYPDFKYILSTTRCERDVNKINEYTKQYDMVVIDYRDNKDLEFLNKLEDKDKIEILIDSYCIPDCQWREDHYKHLSFDQVYRTTTENELFTGCGGTKDFYTILNYSTTFTVNELYKYQEMGFYNFKIEGRTQNHFDVLESYIYYLIKPEYQNIVRLEILKNC